MSAHSRTISESSFDFVKSDEEHLLNQEEKEKKEVQNSTEVLSFNGDISSENENESSEESEDNISEIGVSEEERISLNEETDELKKSDTVSRKITENMGDCVGDSLGLPVENAKIVDQSDEKKVQIRGELVQNKQDLESQVEPENDKKSDNTESETEVLQSDPLGAIETPILLQKNSVGVDENIASDTSSASVILTELRQMRSEIDEIKQLQIGQNEMLVELQRKIEMQEELELQKEKKRYSPILTAICGEWRLLDMGDHNKNLKNKGISFPNRLKTLVSHTMYDFDGSQLTSFNKLFCKSFNHASLKFGLDMFSGKRSTFSNTFVRNETLVTIWKDERGVYYEKKERYVKDGKLYKVHTNRFGEKQIQVYERVQAKIDILYSIGNASRLYLKFW